MRITRIAGTLTYEVREGEILLTVHRWFAKKSCPGNWLMERLGSLADEVNGKLGMEEIKEPAVCGCRLVNTILENHLCFALLPEIK